MHRKRPQSETRYLREVISLSIVVVAFVVSRIAYHKAGIRFDMTSLEWYWQYIDPSLLRTRLLESTYYLHSQPPLFNLFLGVVLKAFPGRELLAFGIAYKALGIIIALSMYTLMRGMRVRISICTALTIAFIVSPTCILFENWLFYAYPLAGLICLSAVLLYGYSRTGELRYGVPFFSLLAVIVLMRSLFHLAWFILIVGAILMYGRLNRRRVALACLVPLLAICFIYTKNLVLFDSFASSTWLGMSFGKMTTFRIPEDTRRDLIGEGRISQLSLIRPFSPIDAYRGHVTFPEKTGIPVLDQERKARGLPKFSTNFNNLVFVEISKQYLDDALEVLRSYPRRYGQMAMLSLGIYFFPSNEYRFFEGNRSRIGPLDDFYNRAIYGQILLTKSEGWKTRIARRHDTGRLEPIGLFLIAGFVAFIITGWRHIRLETDPPLRTTILFIFLTVIYVTVVTSLVEIGENHRFRFIVDPLIVTGIGLCLNDVLNLVGRRSPALGRGRGSRAGEPG